MQIERRRAQGERQEQTSAEVKRETQKREDSRKGVQRDGNLVEPSRPHASPVARRPDRQLTTGWLLLPPGIVPVTGPTPTYPATGRPAAAKQPRGSTSQAAVACFAEVTTSQNPMLLGPSKSWIAIWDLLFFNNFIFIYLFTFWPLLLLVSKTNPISPPLPSLFL
jgi:hypothetical protein